MLHVRTVGRSLPGRRARTSVIFLLLSALLPHRSCAASRPRVAELLGGLPAELRVHAFYYLWYGSPSVDGEYKHWNHEVLPHWNTKLRDTYPHGTRFEPPEEVHGPNYPSRGCYSSRDPEVLREHMAELRGEASVGVVAVSWWGPAWREGTTDTQGVQTDDVLPLVLEAAQDMGMKVAFHLEPYPGRSATSVREDLLYLMGRVGAHPAVLRVGGLPLYYVYDSYHIPPGDWAALLFPNGELSLRGGPADGIFVGLWLNSGDGEKHIKPGGFDGFYTYFASEAVSFASNPQRWGSLSKWAAANDMLFIPSVGPGYDDSGIRPWNAEAKRERLAGRRYEQWWESAVGSRPGMVSITSYNEWGEGTQIEPAIDYGVSAGSNMTYISLTSKWSKKYQRAIRAEEEPSTAGGNAEL